MSFDNQPGTKLACFLGVFAHRLPDLIVKTHQEDGEEEMKRSKEKGKVVHTLWASTP
jgi:hypothetical protein